MLLWKRKLLIALGLVIGLTAGVVWVAFQVPHYRAATTIEIVGFNESFMGMNQFDPQAGTGNNGSTVANIQTQLRIIQSPALLRRTADRVNLELSPVAPNSGGPFGRIRIGTGRVPQDPVAFMRRAVGVAAGTTSARAVGASRLIDISCESTAPDVASAFANALAAEYISQNAQLRTSSATRTAQWLESQIEETKNRLDQADARLQEFIKKEGIAFVLDQNTLADTKLRQLQADLSNLQTDRITKQSRYEMAKSSPVDSLPEILDDGTLKGLRDKLSELRRERALLTTTLTADHYKVKRLDSMMAEVEQTLQREKSNLVKRIQNEYEAALRREKLLASAYASQSSTLASQAEKAAEYALRKREVEMARQSYTLLQQQFAQAAMVAAVPTNNVRVLDRAYPYNVPSRPKPVNDIATAGISGAAIAIGLSVLIERKRLKRRKKVFETPGHVANALNVPELGVIPALEAPRESKFRFAKSRMLGKGRTAILTAEDVVDEESRGLIQGRGAEASFLMESFRNVLTSLLTRRSAGASSVLIVTSPGPSEGKTTLVSNLGVAMAETGRRVLLLDADLRRSRLHKVFGLPSKEGLAELLQSDVSISKLDLSKYIQFTGVDGLSLLTCGSAPLLSVGAMLFSQRVPELVAELRRRFDFVLIDTAPSQHFSDARQLSRLSDGVILIVRSGVTARDAAVTTAQRFAEDGAPILGTILNDWTPGAGAPQYSDYLHYYHATKGSGE